MKTGFAAALVPLILLLVFSVTAGAQKQDTATAASETRKDTKRIETGAVTINMPEGMTKDQADAILNELRLIRQLLEKQQNTGSQTAATPMPQAPPKVNMSLGNGWYSLGRDDAPLTLVEFSDYQCPFCGRFHSDTFIDLKKNYIDTGKIRFVSRDLPLSFHPNALGAAEAARCAGEQGKFWEMRNVMISNSTDLSKDAIMRYAQALPLDIGKFRPCMEAESPKTEVMKDVADATALQISGTPTFVLGKTSKDTLSGILIVGAQPYSTFDAAIQQMLSPIQ
jgi:protein-disulfide isomerase